MTQAALLTVGRFVQQAQNWKKSGVNDAVWVYP